MGIKDIHVSFKYMGRSVGEGLDTGITIQSFVVEEGSKEVWIEDYEITLDYCIADKPHQFDDIALMVNAMLSDGHHLQEKIFDCISPEDMARINTKCLEAWTEYWQDVATDHGLAADNQFLI